MSQRRKLTVRFEEAVASLRRDYPEEMQQLTIIPRFGLRGRKAIKEWFKTHEPQARPSVVRSFLWASHQGVFFGLSEEEALLSLHIKKDKPYSQLPVLNHFYFTLEHEFGHRLFVGDQWPTKDNTQIQENAADIFAILRGYAKGQYTTRTLQELYRERKYLAIDKEHALPLSVARALMKVMEEETPASLTPEKVKKLTMKVVGL